MNKKVHKNCYKLIDIHFSIDVYNIQLFKIVNMTDLNGSQSLTINRPHVLSSYYCRPHYKDIIIHRLVNVCLFIFTLFSTTTQVLKSLLYVCSNKSFICFTFDTSPLEKQ